MVSEQVKTVDKSDDVRTWERCTRFQPDSLNFGLFCFCGRRCSPLFPTEGATIRRGRSSLPTASDRGTVDTYHDVWNNKIVARFDLATHARQAMAQYSAIDGEYLAWV